MAMIDLIKKDGIDPEIIPVAGLVVNYPHLSEDFRFHCYQRSIRTAMEIFQNEAENVKQWRDTLFQVVGFYLLLGARRNPEFEADIQKAIVGQSHGLYNELGK